MIKFSEYVTLGHPDRIADYISQSLLDEFIRNDNKTRYAVEVQIKGNRVTLGGEITSTYKPTKRRIRKVVRLAVFDIGYNSRYKEKWGEHAICWKDLKVTCNISQQSPDIAVGLNGWGDQGVFYGYYNCENKGDTYEHKTAKEIGELLFKSGVGGLDIKTQVITRGGEVITVIVAIPLLDEKDKEKVEMLVRRHLKGEYKLIINGTGVYKTHSSIADCGTTGRKLVVDFYGNGSQIGGGSAWTKDGTKADLTLNLYARQLAKEWSIRLQETIRTSIACSIGKREIYVTITNEQGEVLKSYIDHISPTALILRFNLYKPIYASLCRNGLFSRIK